jgi:hypothetical protein
MAMGWQNLHFTVRADILDSYLFLNPLNIRSTIGTMIARYILFVFANIRSRIILLVLFSSSNTPTIASFIFLEESSSADAGRIFHRLIVFIAA